MIRPCRDRELEDVRAVVNEAARVYEGAIPPDRRTEPYMAADELRREVEEGVVFRGWYEEGRLVGVMGLQEVGDVTLIRHAYVLPDRQGEGIGTRLMDHLREAVDGPLLVGTWAAAKWAIEFYEARGFRRIPEPRAGEVLRRYWSIPDRQVETSVVLGDPRWWEREERGGRPAGGG